MYNVPVPLCCLCFCESSYQIDFSFSHSTMATIDEHGRMHWNSPALSIDTRTKLSANLNLHTFPMDLVASNAGGIGWFSFGQITQHAITFAYFFYDELHAIFFPHELKTAKYMDLYVSFVPRQDWNIECVCGSYMRVYYIVRAVCITCAYVCVMHVSSRQRIWMSFWVLAYTWLLLVCQFVPGRLFCCMFCVCSVRV